jgi:hypothetical protein
LSLLTFVGAGCAWPSAERQFLLDFFAACRAYDTTVMARMATAPCNPRTDGVVQALEIVGVDEQPPGTTRPARDVRIAASIRPFGGSPAEQALTVRLEEIDGRWMVTRITRLPASRTSPAASSVPPK